MNTPNLPTPNLPTPGNRSGAGTPITDDLLKRLTFLENKLSHRQRFLMIGKLLSHFRNHLYPEMEIRHQADGTLVVTIPRPAGGQ